MTREEWIRYTFDNDPETEYTFSYTNGEEDYIIRNDSRARRSEQMWYARDAKIVYNGNKILIDNKGIYKSTDREIWKH